MVKDDIIKIVYVIPSLNVGGLEKQLVQHVSFLREKKEYEITLVVLFKTNTTINIKHSIPKDIKLIELNLPLNIGCTGFNQVRKHLSCISPNIVVSSTLVANFVVAAAKPFLGFKQIAREHNIYPERSLWKRILNHVLMRYVVDVYLAVSKEAANSAARQSFLNEQEVRVIENGIDTDVWNNKVSKIDADKKSIMISLGLPSDKKIVLNVARYKKKKNQTLLIDAFLKFTQQHQNYILVCVGGGEEKEALENYTHKLGLSKKVVFFERRADIEKFYTISDLFALTSVAEGFPNVLLEAVYFNLPIVSTPAPGVFAVVDDENIGIVTEGYSDVEYAKALERVSKIDRSNVKVKGVFSKKLASFAVQTIVESYIKLFHELMKTPSQK